MENLVGSGAAPAAEPVKDATIETFEQDVIAASMTTPVIVDFWAEWCGPCKQLAPMLEKAVATAAGKVKLVKVDIDKNQMLASQLRIQSIPTVYAFFQGRPVDGFQGAVPESEIKAFVDRLSEVAGGAATQDPGKEYLAAAAAALEQGDVAAAAQLFAQVAQAEPENLEAIAGLSRCQLALGQSEQARQTLEMAPKEKADDPIFDAIKASLELAEGSPSADLSDLKHKVSSEPEDYEARFDLACGYLAVGEMEPAIDELLFIIEREQDWNEAAARLKLLKVFDALGPKNEVTLRGRRRLSSILFA